MTDRQTAAPVPAVDLTNCDREPIHIPGAIQPHGVLLVLREPALTVTGVSANLEQHLGVASASVLGQPLSALLDEAALQAVRVALGPRPGAEVNPARLVIGGRSYDGIVHRHEGAAFLELEPAPGEAAPARGHHPLRVAGLDLARGLPALAQSVVEEVRHLTGFERVMLYRFDENGHGRVDAEAKDPSLDPYLGLHYPASDIPRQARELYLRNWLRIIPDARYTPVPIVPATRPDTGAPLDLTFAVLRSVSPIHLEYLANIGIRAAMSISLIVRDRLWGLISCANHTGPRFVPYELRSACEVLGRMTSLQIAALADREVAAARGARRSTQASLAAAMRAGPDVLEGLLARPVELLGLVGADGAAVVRSGSVSACGKTPPSDFITALAAWLDERAEPDPFSSSGLPALFPPAQGSSDTASGLLTVTLPGTHRRRLLWFRRELVETVNWGGDPRKPVDLDPGMRLHPRRSFALWREEVRQRSSAWSASDLEAAEDLRRYAVEADLERQLDREQEAVRARDDLVAVVSHDLRNPLGVIQMQAAFLLRASEAADEEPSRRLRASAERIQRSVERMNALIHDLLDLAKIEAGRFALQRHLEAPVDMIEDALIIMRPLAESRRLTVRSEVAEAPRIPADRERIFQVLSNLVGNAIKFTPDGGVIELRVRSRGPEVLFTVADTGPGIAADQLPHVFNRYWQARKESREGAGLGLYIAKGIVEAHGGRIWVEASASGGACFHFTLPGA